MRKKKAYGADRVKEKLELHEVKIHYKGDHHAYLACCILKNKEKINGYKKKCSNKYRLRL